MSIARRVHGPEVRVARESGFESEQAAVYGEALDALNKASVRYMLGGAMAVYAYTGLWRDTKDLDLFMLEETVPHALKALERAGFETEIRDPLWLAKGFKGDFFVDIIHANVHHSVRVEEAWFTNAKEVMFLGRPVLVVPAEELILSKLFVAARNRWDMSDVLHIVFALRADLDWRRLLAKVGEHWELLLAYLHLYRYVYPSHAHYLPDWVLKLLLERTKEEIEAAPQEEGPVRFRGTMLDAASFTGDVKEWDLPDERAAAREAWRLDQKQGQGMP